MYLSSVISIILMGLLLTGILFTSQKVAKQEQRHKLADTIQLTVSELRVLANEYSLHQEKRMEEQWYLRYNSTFELLTAATAADTEDDEIINQIKVDYKALDGLFKEIVANYKERETLVQDQDSLKNIGINAEHGNRITSQLLIKSQTVFANSVRYAEKASARADNARKTSRDLIIFLTVMNLLNLLTMTIIVSRNITRSVNKLAKGAEIIGKGNLEHQIDITSKDEIGDLARAFDRMRVSVKILMEEKHV